MVASKPRVACDRNELHRGSGRITLCDGFPPHYGALDLPFNTDANDANFFCQFDGVWLAAWFNPLPRLARNFSNLVELGFD